MKSIVLLSSGLDSVVAFKEAQIRSERILCVTFDYGQKAVEKEISYSKKICDIYKIPHQVIELPWYRTFSGSLTGDGALPEISGNELDNNEIAQKSAEQVWVPARNVVFLSIAAAFAENYKYDTIVTGFDAEEASTFPDNTGEFVERFNQMLEFGTLSRTVVFAPLIAMDKSEIVMTGMKINAPFEFSWSCYDGKEAPCGVCESCLRRKRAFEKAGINDPLLERLKRI